MNLHTAVIKSCQGFAQALSLPALAVLLSHTLPWGSSWIMNVEHLNASLCCLCSRSEELPPRRKKVGWNRSSEWKHNFKTDSSSHTLWLNWRCNSQELMEDIFTLEVEWDWIIKREGVILWIKRVIKTHLCLPYTTKQCVLMSECVQSVARILRGL